MERNNQLTALDEYIKKMYTNILLLIPGACLYRLHAENK